MSPAHLSFAVAHFRCLTTIAFASRTIPDQCKYNDVMLAMALIERRSHDSPIRRANHKKSHRAASPSKSWSLERQCPFFPSYFPVAALGRHGTRRCRFGSHATSCWLLFLRASIHLPDLLWRQALPPAH